MQGWESEPSWEVDEEYPDLSPPGPPKRKTSKKTQLKVHEVLQAWEQDAMAKEMIAASTLDKNGEMLMRRTLRNIRKMRHEINYKITDHVLGLSVPHKLSKGNIQALATVFLESWYDDFGKLHEEQGARHPWADAEVPVVYISEIVKKPAAHTKKLAVSDLIHVIVPWAQEMGRLVTITPANKEIEDYYKDLGFQRIDAFALTMVYHGNHEQVRLSQDLLLDFHLGPPKTRPKIRSPRKWRTGYMLYSGAVRPQVKAAMRDGLAEGEKLLPMNVLKAIAVTWTALSQEERDEWNMKAETQRTMMRASIHV